MRHTYKVVVLGALGMIGPVKITSEGRVPRTVDHRFVERLEDGCEGVRTRQEQQGRRDELAGPGLDEDQVGVRAPEVVGGVPRQVAVDRLGVLMSNAQDFGNGQACS